MSIIDKNSPDFLAKNIVLDIGGLGLEALDLFGTGTRSLLSMQVRPIMRLKTVKPP